MDDPLWHDKSLPGLKLNGLLLKVDDEATLKNKEKLIVIVVLVPVVFALHHTQTNYGVIDLAQSLIEPLSFHL